MLSRGYTLSIAHICIAIILSCGMIALPFPQASVTYAQTSGSDDGDSNNAFLIALAAAGFAILAAKIAADAAKQAVQPAFGGRIIAWQPVCVAPAGILINIASPKPPQQLMYLTPGSFSFANGPPAFIGQQILGNAAITPVPCMIPCPAGLCPHPQGGGLPILFHGSSALPS